MFVIGFIRHIALLYLLYFFVSLGVALSTLYENTPGNKRTTDAATTTSC